MRSHPPTLLKIAERTLVEECALERGERLVVAVSGGGDSTALLHVLSRLAGRLGISLVAHGVDHGLRPDASRELDLVESFCRTLGVAFGRTRVDVGSGGNLQARAREARRAALVGAAAAAGARRIATAHHADDRAETVLMRILNGAQLPALGVLPPTDGILMRPLIRARKADILRHIERHGLEHVADPSNQDRRFLRVRVRLEALPVLEQLSPAVVSHLNALADDAAGASGGAPVVHDDTGRPVALRRAQAAALRRAMALEISARIRLSGDREIVVGPVAGPDPGMEARVHRARPRPVRGPSGQKGGAKSEKRG
jgi:tRNA(Ile)-lysidine synthase